MIPAYSDLYLEDAMRNLGEAVDYAVNDCGIDIDEFMTLFISTGIADTFSHGNAKYVSGMSGTELTIRIVEKSGLNIAFQSPQIEYGFSSEYWCGWIIAYYQWKTGLSFKDIFAHIKMSEVQKMYYPLHEANEDKFVDVFNEMVKTKNTTSKLQTQRKIRGLSQSELAAKSGVNLRTLQQYELKTKDINKASVKTVMSLATVLGCEIDALLEIQL